MRKFPDGDDTVTAKDLLGRTVLYKVGHHGSHNATLDGGPDSDYPNLGWMARGKYAREFTAMITAVRTWAETQNGWDHPRKAIKDALLKKASGRVFQTDTDFDTLAEAERRFRRGVGGVHEANEGRQAVLRLPGEDLTAPLCPAADVSVPIPRDPTGATTCPRSHSLRASAKAARTLPPT